MIRRWRSFNWTLFWRLVRLFALCLVLLVVLQTGAPAPNDVYTGAAAYARDNLFNYISWELDALTGKAFEWLFGVAPYMAEADRADIVRAYMADLSRLYALESDITRLYSDPAVSTPDAASAALRAERDSLRADLRRRQGMVEHILEEQISAVLVDEGLGWLGQVIPPVALHITPLPDVLIISPRDEIRVQASLSLTGLPVDAQAALEDAVDAEFNVASLVVPIGGMGLYPSMVGEWPNLAWTVETSAHEWAHHYLFFFPLGLLYFDDGNPDTRIINETAADVIGKEIAARVLRRYYPEVTPPRIPGVDDPPAPLEPPPPNPDAFDFGAAMHATRVTVDRLLAEGRIDEAEVYMEERRVFFNQHGYTIRKLNQAYFAFYGGYQAEEIGLNAAGEDPLGPAVIALRRQSGSLANFMAAIRSITTREELLAAVESP